MNWTCKHCKNHFDYDKPYEKANHSRWCEMNPKSKLYRDKLKHSRNAITQESRDTASKKIKQNWKKGNYDNADHGKAFRGKTHTKESRSKISKAALNSNHRRLRKNSINYNGILLDSTWELELAKRLDDISIKWERPEPLPYIKEGQTHNYFPDFYLPDYDLYVDPKNPHACRVQSDKIEILMSTYSNIVILKSLEECKTYIPR